MKRVLLDTHVFLWWLADSPRLGSQMKSMIADSRNEIYVSAVSVWEVSIKQAIGKLKAPDDLDAVLEDEGFLSLSIDAYHAKQAGKLPEHHKDPFDRMLIAQAQSEGLIIATSDEKFPAYQINLISADI